MHTASAIGYDLIEQTGFMFYVGCNMNYMITSLRVLLRYTYNNDVTCSASDIDHYLIALLFKQTTF